LGVKQGKHREIQLWLAFKGFQLLLLRKGIHQQWGTLLRIVMAIQLTGFQHLLVTKVVYQRSNWNPLGSMISTPGYGEVVA
jgi:hypothetical protein